MSLKAGTCGAAGCGERKPYSSCHGYGHGIHAVTLLPGEASTLLSSHADCPL